MATDSEALSIAVEHLQAGRLADAERNLLQILAAEPEHADALHHLAVMAYRAGQYLPAIEFLQRLLRLRPDSAELHHFAAIVHKHAGRLDDAIASYRRALELNPAYVEAHNNLAIALMEKGSAEEAIDCYRKAVELKPDYAKARNNLGSALQGLKRYEEAIECYRRAMRVTGDSPETVNNLGTCLAELGLHTEAIQCYQRAIQLKPAFAEAHFNLANAYQHRGRFPDAVQCYRRSLDLNNEFVDSHLYLGYAYQEAGDLEQALACFRQAKELKPDNPAALCSLVNVLQHLCLWDETTDLSREAMELVDRQASSGKMSASPLQFLALPVAASAAAQLQCARAYGMQYEPLGRKPLWRVDSTAGRKLTIGYLSADFRRHPVAFHFADMLVHHDRQRLTTIGYSIGPDDGSAIRRKLENSFDQFVDLREMGFVSAAERIAGDRVDILVDLTGHTQHARTQILALRPAPIQVNYLGFPGTMGAPFIDYLIADDYTIPRAIHSCYSEKVVSLPGCFMTIDPLRDRPQATPTRADFGMPEQSLVFCSFNNCFKITKEIFEVWMNLILEVPGSVLWLLAANPVATANLRRHASLRGVSADRLLFAERTPGAEYLARYRCADLFLDTPIYNAHSTACESLKMGCPVLTLSGETFSSRVAGSLLRAAGLSELITTTYDEYQAVALRLARNPGLLAGTRARLMDGVAASPLFDPAQLARNIESAYQTMWSLHAAQLPPRAFAVDATEKRPGLQP